MKRSVPIYRLAALILLPLTLAHAGATGWLLMQTRQAHEERTRQPVERTVAVLALAPDSLAAQRLVEEVGTEAGYERVLLVEEKGTILASNRKEEISREAGADLQHLLSRSRDDRFSRPVGEAEEARLLVASRPAAGAPWAVALYDAGPAQGALGRALGVLLGGSLGLWLLLVAIVFLVLQQGIARPLEKLRSEMAKLVEEGVMTDVALKRVETETQKAAGGLVHTFTDLARRHRETLALHGEAEARYQTVLDLVPEFVLVAALDGHLIDVNLALCNLLNVPREELRGKPLSALHPLVPGEALLALGRRSHSERCAYNNLDLDFRTREGRVLPVAVAVHAIRYQGHWAFLILAADRTERASLEKQVAGYADSVELMLEERTTEYRQAMDLLKQVMNASGVLLAAFDGTSKVLHWNQKAADLTGYDEAAMPDLACFVENLLPDTATRERFTDWLTGSERESPLLSEVRDREGRRHPVLWTARTVRREDGGTAGVLVGIDLADRQQQHGLSLDERLCRLEAERDDARAALEHFTDSVTHDLQEPLRSIFGLVELIKATEGDGFGEAQGQFLDMLQEASTRFSERLDRLHAFSQARRSDLSLQIINLKGIVETAVVQHRLSPPQGARPLEIELDDDLPLAHGDEDAVRQLVRQLLDNAALYNEQASARVHVGGQREDDATVYWLEDNGVGIPEEARANVFHMFERLHSDEAPGQGAGLALCKHVLDIHGGQIWIDSEADAGTTIFFRLPDQPGLVKPTEAYAVMPRPVNTPEPASRK